MRRILFPALAVCLLLAGLAAGHWHSARGFEQQLQNELKQSPLLKLTAYQPGLLHSDFVLEGLGVRLAGRATHGPVLWSEGRLGAAHVTLQPAADQPAGSLFAAAMKEAPQLAEIRAEADVAYDGSFTFHSQMPVIDATLPAPKGSSPLQLHFAGMTVDGKGQRTDTGTTVTVTSQTPGGTFADGQLNMELGNYQETATIQLHHAAGPLMLLLPDRLERTGHLDQLRLTPVAADAGPLAAVALNAVDVSMQAGFNDADRFGEQLHCNVKELRVNDRPVGAIDYQLKLAELDGPALRQLVQRLSKLEPQLQQATDPQALEAQLQQEMMGAVQQLLQHQASVSLALHARLNDFGDNRWQLRAHLDGSAADLPLAQRVRAETRLELADPAALTLAQLFLMKSVPPGQQAPPPAALLANLCGDQGMLVRQKNGYLLQVKADLGQGTLTLGNGRVLPLASLLPPPNAAQ